MKNRSHGFSLIEVLIVLILIGMIATLLTTIMGNPLKKSTTAKSTYKISQDMQNIYDGGQYYYAEYGTILSNDDIKWRDELTKESGIMIMIPVPPDDAKHREFNEDDFKYYLDFGSYSGWADETKGDTVIYLDGVNDEVCEKVNDEYTDLGTEIASSVDYNYDIHCFTSSIGNRVVKPIFLDDTGE